MEEEEDRYAYQFNPLGSEFQKFCCHELIDFSANRFYLDDRAQIEVLRQLYKREEEKKRD